LVNNELTKLTVGYIRSRRADYKLSLLVITALATLQLEQRRQFRLLAHDSVAWTLSEMMHFTFRCFPSLISWCYDFIRQHKAIWCCSWRKMSNHITYLFSDDLTFNRYSLLLVLF